VSGKARQLVWPGLMTLTMLVILLSLGLWQLERLAWKNAILADIARAEAGPALALAEHPAAFSKVSVVGLPLHDRAVRYGAEVRPTISGPQMGARVIVPLERPGAMPILIDRGWAPIVAQPLDQPTGQTRIEGYVRPGDTRRWMAAHDDISARRFYTLDPAAIATAMGLGEVAPFVVVALGPAQGEKYPDPARHMPRPANNHLSYAITWFSLAGVLSVVFGLFAWKGLRA
jgi:surfeit locus 1 family protein